MHIFMIEFGYVLSLFCFKEDQNPNAEYIVV